MIRLQRTPAPKDWSGRVKKVLTNYAEYLDRAKEFEEMDLNSAARRAGFAGFAGALLPKRKGQAYFPSAWGKVKEDLWEMSRGKCAYCEGGINASRLGQVEHFRPKSLFPVLAYEWENYFLACGGCNGAKSDQWPRDGGYLRPDEGNPAAELRFETDGTVKAERAGSEAEVTIEHFDLRRKWLVRRRKKLIEQMLGRLRDFEEMYRESREMGRKYAERERGRVSDPEGAYSAALTQCFSREWERVSSGAE